MSKKINIELDEAIRVYKLISEVKDFMHQPMNFDKTEAFAVKNIKEIGEIYYKIMWEWLPKNIQEKLIEE